MVQPKLTNVAAVAQHARRKQKETESKDSNRPLALPQVPSTVNKPKKQKKQMAETDKEIRNRNERKLLRKELKKGIPAEKIDVRKVEKILDGMQQDEKTGEDPSEYDCRMSNGRMKTEQEWKRDRKKKNLEIEKKPITQTKMLQKYKIDRDDYMLQYATADEKPLYFEEYEPTAYPCFHSTNPCLWGYDPGDTFDRLLKYTNEIMKTYVPMKTDHFPQALMKSDELRITSPYSNFCFNPVQAMRAWALLANIAQNKTLDELSKYIEHYTNMDYNLKGQSINKRLLSLHVDAEFLFDGCVRLFTELPRHLHHDVAIRRKISTYYGGKSRRAGIQHHCFQTDSDGFYSCYRINQEISLSTRGAVRYVVPENSAPNWRASIALASAIDCTFHWKTIGNESEESANFKFFNDGKIDLTEKNDATSETYKKRSMCVVIQADATVGVQTEEYEKNNENPKDVPPRYRLESLIPGVYLYIIPEDPNNVMKKKSLPSNILDIIHGEWTLKTGKVYIPKCTTSIPISLYEHAKHNGLSRIFSGEKSELRELKHSGFDKAGSPQFATLFDHYHKTVFEITTSRPGKNDDSRKFDELGPDRAHQSIDDSMANVFGKFQMGEDCSNAPFLTYTEGHLDQSTCSLLALSDYTVAKESGINLAVPFYYVMTRPITTMKTTSNTDANGKTVEKDAEIISPMIVCAGYFNNTSWVKTEK